MITLRCQFCSRLFEVDSSMIGTELKCQGCLRTLSIDLNLLARFEVPSHVVVRIVEADGRPWKGKPVVVLLQRWARLPPMKTDASGRLEVDGKDFAEAVLEAQSENIMGAKGDPRLVRYIYAHVLSRTTGMNMALRRRGSGWRISKFESRFYGDIEALLDAFSPADAEDVQDANGFLDLASGQEEVVVRVSKQGDERTG